MRKDKKNTNFQKIHSREEKNSPNIISNKILENKEFEKMRQKKQEKKNFNYRKLEFKNP